jgi:hypothetical protein
MFDGRYESYKKWWNTPSLVGIHHKNPEKESFSAGFESIDY